MDVPNAFLHRALTKEVYMKLHPCFKCSNMNKICWLRKSLYGLMQAPHCSFAKLVMALKGYDFRQSYSVYSLFAFAYGKLQVKVLVYGDNLIISGNNSATIKACKAYLRSYFKLKELGTLKYFLGIAVSKLHVVHRASSYASAGTLLTTSKRLVF